MLEVVASNLGEAARALQAVDPERLWRHLDEVEARRAADQERHSRELRRLLIVVGVATAGSICSLAILVLLTARVIAL